MIITKTYTKIGEKEMIDAFVDIPGYEGHYKINKIGEEAFRIKYKETGPHGKIAKRYNVSRSTISMIKKGATWTSI